MELNTLYQGCKKIASGGGYGAVKHQGYYYLVKQINQEQNDQTVFALYRSTGLLFKVVFEKGELSDFSPDFTRTEEEQHIKDILINQPINPSEASLSAFSAIDAKVLFNLVEAIAKSWEFEECIEWSEAEQIVRECRKIPKEQLQALPVIKDVLKYADTHEDWDCGVVGNWPDKICWSLQALF